MLQPATITWERQNKDGHEEHSLNIVTDSGPMLSDQHDWPPTGNVFKTLPHTHSGVSHRMGGPDTTSWLITVKLNPTQQTQTRVCNKIYYKNKNKKLKPDLVAYYTNSIFRGESTGSLADENPEEVPPDNTRGLSNDLCGW